MRTAKAFMAFIVIVLALSTSPTSTYAWYGPYYHPNGDAGDVHRDDTKAWALEAGMKKVWAVQMAESCAMVDVYFKTNLQWHLDRSDFTGDTEDTRVKTARFQMTLAKREIDAAAQYQTLLSTSKTYWNKLKYGMKLAKAKGDAVFYLGRSLHPVQDLYAHMDAGKNKTDTEIGMSHGMLEAEPVDVTVIEKDGTTSIRKMKLEEKGPDGALYSLYDDAFYDYDGGWIFRVDGKKEDNRRWKETRAASLDSINDFLLYAADKGISYK